MTEGPFNVGQTSKAESTVLTVFAVSAITAVFVVSTKTKPDIWHSRRRRIATSITSKCTGVYICKPIVNYSRHGNFICKSEEIYLGKGDDEGSSFASVVLLEVEVLLDDTVPSEPSSL